MSKVPSPRLPKKLRPHCGILCSFSRCVQLDLRGDPLHDPFADQFRIEPSPAGLPKLEEAAELYIQANKAPSAREKKMVFPQAKSPEKKG